MSRQTAARPDFPGPSFITLAVSRDRRRPAVTVAPTAGVKRPYTSGDPGPHQRPIKNSQFVPLKGNFRDITLPNCITGACGVVNYVPFVVIWSGNSICLSCVCTDGRSRYV